MNIPSKIVIEAIDFAKGHPKVSSWLKKRDDFEGVTIKSIRSEIVDVSLEYKSIFIRVFIDYLARAIEFGKMEDIIVEIIWSQQNGYTLKNIQAVPEV